MQYIKEVTYRFSVDGLDVTKDAYIDSVIGRRYSVTNGNENIGYEMGSALNYLGTKAEYQEIQAQLLSEYVIYDENSQNPDYKKAIRQLYLLPDVNEYVQLDYVVYRDMPDASVAVTFLSKIANN